jgi:hypothetical protein
MARMETILALMIGFLSSNDTPGVVPPGEEVR